MPKEEVEEKCRWCICRFLICEVNPKNTTARGCPVCDHEDDEKENSGLLEDD